MRWPYVDGMMGTRTVPTLQQTEFFAMLVTRAVGGGFSPRRRGSTATAASRAKAPSQCAHEGAYQCGASPHRGSHIPEAESNCVAARRGGEQLEANWRSVVKRTRYGGVTVANLLGMVKPGNNWTRCDGD